MSHYRINIGNSVKRWYQIFSHHFHFKTFITECQLYRVFPGVLPSKARPCLASRIRLGMLWVEWGQAGARKQNNLFIVNCHAQKIHHLNEVIFK